MREFTGLPPPHISMDAAEKALCTKRHFSNGNHSKKNNSKIPKISKILLSYFSKKKSKKNIFFFSSSAPAASRHHFFFRRLRRLFFFFFFVIGKWKSLGKVKTEFKKKSALVSDRGGTSADKLRIIICESTLIAVGELHRIRPLRPWTEGLRRPHIDYLPPKKAHTRRSRMCSCGHFWP